MEQKAFHLALPCKNIANTKDFYLNTIGAKAGREADKWVDINLFGNQITFTQAGDFNFEYKNYRLGEHVLPSFHFGVIIDVETWGTVYSRLIKSSQEVTSEVTFFEDKNGQHLSFFVKDPNGYMLEFKSFNDPATVFTIN